MVHGIKTHKPRGPGLKFPLFMKLLLINFLLTEHSIYNIKKIIKELYTPIIRAMFIEEI